MPRTMTIFTARNIITMNPGRPEATAVAVRNGRVLGVGTVDELQGWGLSVVDDRYGDCVLTPGLIEAHSHISEGGSWMYPYLGYFDRPSPEGEVVAGLRTIDEVIQRLKSLESELGSEDEPLVAWGFDPIYFPDNRLTAQQLDQVSTTRPIVLVQASLHVVTVNSAALRIASVTHDTGVSGVVRDADGHLTGELQEFEAIGLVQDYIFPFFNGMESDEAIRNLGKRACHAGCTTITEMGMSPFNTPEARDRWVRMTGEGSFPVRVVGYLGTNHVESRRPDDILAAFAELKAHETEKLRFGGVKVFLDGSIQGLTARIEWPGYYHGPENGQWNMAPEDVAPMLQAFHDAGVQVSAHCNGDEATRVFVDAVESALLKTPWTEHRHTVQHGQIISEDLFARMARLGVAVNLFVNHVFYWGDQHYNQILGPDRADALDACGSALRAGVHFSLHSDANVTPIDQLHTMWCAVNRRTASGRVLGNHQKISAHDALRAVTVDAAYLLNMENEIGSIAIGKRADFTALEENPLTVDPMHIKDIAVRDCVLGGDPVSDLA